MTGTILIKVAKERRHECQILLLKKLLVRRFPPVSARKKANICSQLLVFWTAEKDIHAGKSCDGALLLHFDPLTKKFVAKEQALVGKQQGSLKPCELKFQDLVRHMIPLTCRSKSLFQVQAA